MSYGQVNILFQSVNCGLDLESIKVLSKCEWKLLKQLSFSGNNIADDSIECLSRVNWY